MAGTAVQCISCLDLYPNRQRSTRAPLGEAPNKHCYRAKCHARGIELGHIKGGQKRATAGGGASGSNSNSGVSPEPMHMAREMPSGTASFVEIKDVYGFR